MRIAFRADASLQMGTGHIMRCLTLATALRERGAICHFICRGHPGHLMGLINQRGFSVSALPIDVVGIKNDSWWGENFPRHFDWLGCCWRADADQTCNILKDFNLGWLVVDHYALDARWEKLVRKKTFGVLAIDDLADRSHECDILLDQNWFGDCTETRYEGLVNKSCLHLLGPKYALLNPEYQLLRDRLPKRKDIVRRVLVFMGGSDPTNETAKVIDAMNESDLSGLIVDVVLGVNHPDSEGVMKKVRDRPGTFLHQNIPSLASLMASADLMISAGGSTTWERMCLGLPAIVISIAENQTSTSQTQAHSGYINFLGEMREVDSFRIATAVRQAMKCPRTLQRQSDLCMTLVDGRGAERVAESIFSKGSTRVFAPAL